MDISAITDVNGCVWFVVMDLDYWAEYLLSIQFRSFDFVLQNTFRLFRFQLFLIWAYLKRLFCFKKPFVRTKFDVYVFFLEYVRM
jgi:hypothetical protein